MNPKPSSNHCLFANRIFLQTRDVCPVSGSEHRPCGWLPMGAIASVGHTHTSFSLLPSSPSSLIRSPGVWISSGPILAWSAWKWRHNHHRSIIAILCVIGATSYLFAFLKLSHRPPGLLFSSCPNSSPPPPERNPNWSPSLFEGHLLEKRQKISTSARVVARPLGAPKSFPTLVNNGPSLGGGWLTYLFTYFLTYSLTYLFTLFLTCFLIS